MRGISRHRPRRHHTLASRVASRRVEGRTKNPSSPLSPPSLMVAANAGEANARVVAATTAACVARDANECVPCVSTRARCSRCQRARVVVVVVVDHGSREAWRRHPRHPIIDAGYANLTHARFQTRVVRAGGARRARARDISHIKSSTRSAHRERRSRIARPATRDRSFVRSRDRAREGHATASPSSSPSSERSSLRVALCDVTRAYLLDVFERRRGGLGDGRLGDGRLGDNLDAGERARDRGHRGRA